MRHFEKTSGNRLFQSIDCKGLYLYLSFGIAGDYRFGTKVKYKNVKQAKISAENWISNALRSGYKEFEVGTKLGAKITSIEGSKGARAASDDQRNIFIDSKIVRKLNLKQGSRVLLSQIHKSKESSPSFMFESPWVAGEVELFPRPLKHQVTKYKAFSGAEVARLKQKVGSKILGRQERRKVQKFKCGDLIFSYFSGVSRFIGYSRVHGILFPVMCPVLGVEFKRANASLPLSCHPIFCEKVPAFLAAKIESQ